MPKQIEITWDDSEFQRIVKHLEKLDSTVLSVGFHEDKGGGNIHPNSNLTNAELAMIHEYGSPSNNIPERPFIRNTLKKHQDKVIKEFSAGLEDIFKDINSPKSMLTKLGKDLVQDMKNEITSGELKPTKDGKDPLNDTGTLLRNITFKVELD